MVIPGNRNLRPEQKAARAEAIYWPYHRAIDAEIKRLARERRSPAVIAIHSFTPVLDGVSRPWGLGILWEADPRIAGIQLSKLADAGLVGGNTASDSLHSN